MSSPSRPGVTLSVPPHPSTPTALIQTFLSLISTKSTAIMRQLAHPSATATLIRSGTPKFMTLGQAITNLDKAEEQLIETIWDTGEYIDGEFAAVWTKFRIERDGALHQLGSSSFTCWKNPEAGWVITGMSDVAREQGK